MKRWGRLRLKSVSTKCRIQRIARVSRMSGWIVFIVTYLVLAAVTLFPTVKAMMKKFDLQEAKFSFTDALHFSDDQKTRLEHHYSRLQGTLVFWKNNAEKYGYLHFYCVFWIIIGGIATPVLIQAIDVSNPNVSKWCVTIVAIHVALLSAVHKGFKVEQNYKNFRLGESEYFDLRRRVLDQPHLLATDTEAQIAEYFSTTEAIRRDMRNKEIDSIASFEEVKATVQSLAGHLGSGPKK